MTRWEPYNEATANTTDRIAWNLCQIIDDDAPMRWTRYRFAAKCIALNKDLLKDLAALAKQEHAERALSRGEKHD